MFYQSKHRVLERHKEKMDSDSLEQELMDVHRIAQYVVIVSVVRCGDLDNNDDGCIRQFVSTCNI